MIEVERDEKALDALRDHERECEKHRRDVIGRLVKLETGQTWLRWLVTASIAATLLGDYLPKLPS